jgi:D-alanyl-D-alanine-carboxypeptidase/D-alanyl-D-alanine-endopeptidase
LVRFFAAMTLLFASSLGHAKPPNIPERVEQRIQEYISACGYSTMFVGLVDGDDIRTLSYGKMANNKAADESTQFEIGSLTQTFTALLLARDIGAGKLTPNTPIATLLPGFHIASRNGKFITVENLATQRSGLPWLPSNFSPASLDVPYRDYGDKELRKFFAAFSLTRDPGETYEDSTLGIGTLGFALSQSSGSFEQRVTREILTPLGMLQTRFAPRAWDRVEAPGHSADKEPARDWQWDVLAPAGTMVSSGGDMLTYLRANMGIGRSPLYPAMQLAQQARADSMPDNRIGLVWMTQHRSGTDVIWHHGITAGYASFLGFTGDRRRGVIILASAARSVDDFGFAILRNDWPLPPRHPDITLTAEQLGDYVGSYLLDSHFVVSVSREDRQLLLEIPGRPMFLIFSIGGDEFVLDSGDLSIGFRRNRAGRVDQLVLHQQDIRRAPKLSDRQLEAMQTHTPSDANRAILNDYVGEYELGPGSKLSLRVDGLSLRGQLGQQFMTFFPVARDRFIYNGGEAAIGFARDETGRVLGVVLFQNGVPRRAPRIEP